MNVAGVISRVSKVSDTQIDNRNSSVLIEINGDLTRGGYQLLRYPPEGADAAPRYDFVTMSVPHGGADDEAMTVYGAQRFGRLDSFAGLPDKKLIQAATSLRPMARNCRSAAKFEALWDGERAFGAGIFFVTVQAGLARAKRRLPVNNAIVLSTDR